MIHFYSVSMEYKRGVPVLRDVTFGIDKGEFVFLVGPSGAGKTTVLRLIYREIKPTSGEIVVAGKNLSRMKDSQIPYLRRIVGVVFQDFKLLPRKTIFENVALALKVTGASRAEIRRKVNRVLDLVGLSHCKDAYPEEVSGGEQQRAAIARALVNDPLILLADEPTGNLDPALSLEIMKLFESLNYRGTTVFIATHDYSLVRSMRKRVIMIERGRVFE